MSQLCGCGGGVNVDEPPEQPEKRRAAPAEKAIDFRIRFMIKVSAILS
jgi:hypothetical protein